MGDHYYRFFPGDYLRDTQGLTLTENGAYRMLLDSYYSQEYLPDDIQELYIICRAFKDFEQKAVDKVISKYFSKNGNGHLINRKAEEEIAGRKAYFNEQVRKAKLGAEARWKDHKKEMPTGIATGMPTGMPERCPPSPSPSPSPIPSPKKVKTHTGEKVELPDWMPEEIWSVFLSHRKACKAPITEKAHAAFIEKFLRLKTKGWEPKAVVDTMIEKGWRWFKPEWVEKDRMRSEFGEKGSRTVKNLQEWLNEEDEKDAK